MSIRGIARASLINLAIYKEGTDSLEQEAEIVGEIVKEAACRSILIGADATGETSIRAWVQAHCNFVGRDQRKTVCTEQLAFLLSGATPGLVRNTVLANLDSDLPLVFWWQGEFSEAFSERLYTRIDRLVFDSFHWADPRAQFLRLTQAQKNESFVAHDLSFTRLNPVRGAITKCFDSPQNRGEARRIDEMEIRFGAEHRNTANYLAAWVASRLKCDLDTSKSFKDRFVFDRRSSGHSSSPLQVTMTEEDSRRSIVEVVLRSPNAKISVCRDSAGKFWELRSKIGECPEILEIQPTGERDDVSLITEILTRGGRNHILCEVLPLVQQMLVV